MASRRARPWFLSPTAYIRRAGVTKGLLGGSTGWLSAGVALWAVGKTKRTLGKQEEFAAIEHLKPGECVTIKAIPVPTRSENRASARSAKAAEQAAVREAKAAKLAAATAKLHAKRDADAAKPAAAAAKLGAARDAKAAKLAAKAAKRGSR